MSVSGTNTQFSRHSLAVDTTHKLNWCDTSYQVLLSKHTPMSQSDYYRQRRA